MRSIVTWIACLLALFVLAIPALAVDNCIPNPPALTPDMPEYHEALGGQHFVRKEFEAAIAAYEQSLALDPDYMHGYYGLAMTYRAMGRLDLAIEHYGKCMQLTPEYASPYLARAEIYQFLNRDDQALADLNRYVEVYGQYPIAYIARGDFFMENREYGHAIEDYEAALGKGPAPSAEMDLRLKLARARVLMGDVAGAEVDFEAGLSIVL